MFMLVGRQNNADNVVMALPLAFKAMKVLVFRPSQSMYYDILHSSWLSCISCLLTFWVSDMVFLGWFRCIDFSVLTYFICYLKKAEGHVFLSFIFLCVCCFFEYNFQHDDLLGDCYAIGPSSCLSLCNIGGVLWPNSWTDQDETWHVGRPRLWPHCVRWGPSSPFPKGGAEPPK